MLHKPTHPYFYYFYNPFIYEWCKTSIQSIPWGWCKMSVHQHKYIYPILIIHQLTKPYPCKLYAIQQPNYGDDSTCLFPHHSNIYWPHFTVDWLAAITLNIIPFCHWQWHLMIPTNKSKQTNTTTSFQESGKLRFLFPPCSFDNSTTVTYFIVFCNVLLYYFTSNTHPALVLM